MPLTIGSQLGSHEITALLGKGGMGEVYRARDAKLKREVAIKILPDEFSRDGDRVARFQREAEELAALNHQNIGAIYDLKQVDNTRFLILELVEFLLRKSRRNACVFLSATVTSGPKCTRLTVSAHVTTFDKASPCFRICWI